MGITNSWCAYQFDYTVDVVSRYQGVKPEQKPAPTKEPYRSLSGRVTRVITGPIEQLWAN